MPLTYKKPTPKRHSTWYLALPILGMMATQAASVHLNISRDRTPEEQTDRLPGVSIEYSTGGATRSLYSLPLRVVDFSVTEDSSSVGMLDFQVTFLNVSRDQFLFPSSLNARETEADGNKGRRELLFSIISSGNDESLKSTLVQTTDGSNSVPESYTQLDPGEKIVVKFR